jgi:AraC-like DNA-binding protein
MRHFLDRAVGVKKLTALPDENLADLARERARQIAAQRAQSRSVGSACGSNVHPEQSLSTEVRHVPALVCHDRRVARVLKHVLEDLTRRATCASAARVAGLERAYFSKLFRSVMTVTFTEWNACVRVEEAKRLLRAIDLSITAVSASVGYDDVTTFERVFRRLEGMSPREHRRLVARRAARPTPNAETATPNAETVGGTRE